MAPQAKKKIKEQPFPKGTPVVQPRFYQSGEKCGEKNRVRPNLGTTFTERPGEKCRFFFPLQISLFFFFFLKTSFWKNWFSKPVFLTTLIPCTQWRCTTVPKQYFFFEQEKKAHLKEKKQIKITKKSALISASPKKKTKQKN